MCSAPLLFPKLLVQTVTKSASVSLRRTVVVDSGALKAAIDRNDSQHEWAVRIFKSIPGRFVTCEAAITEAQHLLQNDAVAIRALACLIARMDVIALAPDRVSVALDAARAWAPRMDYADACAIILARQFERAFVLTTDFRDFAVYRVPFASPQGTFYSHGEG